MLPPLPRAGNAGGPPLDPLAVSVLVIKSLESLAEPLFSYEQLLDLLSVAVSNQTQDVKYVQLRAVLESMPPAKRGERAAGPEGRAGGPQASGGGRRGLWLRCAAGQSSKARIPPTAEVVVQPSKRLAARIY